MNDFQTFYLDMAPDERDRLLKLTANEPDLFHKVYDAPTTRFPAILPQSYTFMSPIHPNPEKMPVPDHVGRRVRFDRGTGTIARHSICGDDCSGYWGRQVYAIKQDSNGELISPYGPNDVQFIDSL